MLDELFVVAVVEPNNPDPFDAVVVVPNSPLVAVVAPALPNNPPVAVVLLPNSPPEALVVIVLPNSPPEALVVVVLPNSPLEVVFGVDPNKDPVEASLLPNRPPLADVLPAGTPNSPALVALPVPVRLVEVVADAGTPVLTGGVATFEPKRGGRDAVVVLDVLFPNRFEVKGLLPS